jgi:tetratricopeptide (TPR) repeat protein
MMDRLEALQQLVAQNPADAFARYGLATEYARAGRFADAVAQFEALIEAHPDYAAAYQQGGQALESLGRIADAKEFYRRGIAVTTSQGNLHARDQLQAALDLL